MLKFHQNGLVKFFGKLFCLICHYLTASLHSLTHKASTPFWKVCPSFGNDIFFWQRWGINLLPNPQPGGPGIVIHLAFHPMACEGFLISKGETIELYGMGQTRWNLIYWHIFLIVTSLYKFLSIVFLHQSHYVLFHILQLFILFSLSFSSPDED